MRIVMTGATSGIGRVACEALLAAGHELLIGARDPGAGAAFQARGARVERLDLASLASTRAFVGEIANFAPIDTLILNAGIQMIRPGRSADGFDLTFATNHLAHYLLARLATAYTVANGRVVLTSSGTHDPAEKTGMPPPRHADARLLAFPEQDRGLDADPGMAGRRAYSTSKLANLMTARELAVRLKSNRPDLAIAAFDPGFTPGTGLARGYPGIVSFAFKAILPALSVLGGRVSTPKISGSLLAALAVSPAYAKARGAYFAVRSGRLIETTPSKLAQNAAACAALWDESANMVGLPA